MGSCSAGSEPVVRLHWDERRWIATLTLNRPAVHNAISLELAEELTAACSVLGGSDGLRCVVVTGAGQRAFSAGADLRQRRNLEAAARTRHTAAIDEAAEVLANLPVPTIAAVRGFALAGGAELAIACDLRVAATDAVFGFPEVRVGIFPGAGGVRRLPPLIGLGAARDLLFTGRRVDADEARRLGLIDRLVEPSAHLDAAYGLAATIAENAPLAIRAVKRALGELNDPDPVASRERLRALRTPLDTTADYEEGLAAFAEKRQPRFTGR